MKYKELKMHIYDGPLNNGAFKTTEISELIFMCYIYLHKLFELERGVNKLIYAEFSHEEIKIVCEGSVISRIARPDHPNLAVNYFSIFEKVLEKDQVVASEFRIEKIKTDEQYSYKVSLPQDSFK